VALDSEDANSFAKYKRTLNAIGRDIDRTIGSERPESLSVNIGMADIGVGLSLRAMDGVMRRFGVRAMLNRMILSPSSELTLRRLLRMFGEDRSVLGERVKDYFRGINLKQ
jgi:hypothetical protein